MGTAVSAATAILETIVTRFVEIHSSTQIDGDISITTVEKKLIVKQLELTRPSLPIYTLPDLEHIIHPIKMIVRPRRVNYETITSSGLEPILLRVNIPVLPESITQPSDTIVQIR